MKILNLRIGKIVLRISSLCLLFLQIPSGMKRLTQAERSVTPHARPFVGSNIPVAESLVHLIDPAIAYNSMHEEYLVVWSKWVDTYTRDIWARRIGCNGALHETFVVATSPGAIREDAQVAYSPVQDEYLVVYTNFYDDQSYDDGDIMATRVSWNGGWKSSEFAITNDAVKHTSPSLAYNSVDNEYLVVYSNSGSYDVTAQRVDGDGTLLSWNFVASGLDAQRGGADVAFMPNAYNGDGGYLIAYQFYQGSPYDFHINYKLAQANLAGLNTTPESQIVPGATAQDAPFVTASPDEFLVVWWAYLQTGDQVMGRRISKEGTAVGATSGFPIGTLQPSTYDVGLDVTFSGHGRYLVLWTANEGVGNYRVTGRYSFVEMDDVWRSEFRLGPSGEASYGPDLVCSGYCGCLVSYNWWNASSFDIGAQFIWPFGLYAPAILK